MPLGQTGGDIRRLTLTYSGRIIDHLGLQMYQSPTAALAELIANAWDADADSVDITLPDALDEAAEIIIKDDGNGMTFQECQNRFLNVGYARRGNNPTETSRRHGRTILGRKGIGKFAGFGIARIMRVDTVSEQTGEHTVFEMDLETLRGEQYVTSGAPVNVIEYDEPEDSRKTEHGTEIRLRSLTLAQLRSPDAFRISMARRFLLHQRAWGFAVRVNNMELPEEDLRPVQYSFPRDYDDTKSPAGLAVEGDWGTEALSDGSSVRWRVLFYENTIDDDELRGISIFAGLKLVQAPFFFNLSGGLSGQHGQQYLSGQVQATFLDARADDIVAPERQRVNWEHPDSQVLLAWGRERVRQLLSIWRDNRATERVRRLDERVGMFAERLNKLGRHEQQTVGTAIRRVAQIETLTTSQFEDLATAILTAWEQGRLKDLIGDIANNDDLDETALVGLLTEAQVLAALNTAEAIKTKLVAVENLRKRIDDRQLENAVRDFIALNPWMISPEWETFKKERGVDGLLHDAAVAARLDDADLNGRVDLALSSGNHLLVLEFMRPGLTADWDHVSRFEQYILHIRANLRANTAAQFRRVTGYLIADNIVGRPDLQIKIETLESDNMFASDWRTFLEHAGAQWKDFLSILVSRTPDERLQPLAEEVADTGNSTTPQDA